MLNSITNYGFLQLSKFVTLLECYIFILNWKQIFRFLILFYFRVIYFLMLSFTFLFIKLIVRILLIGIFRAKNFSSAFTAAHLLAKNYVSTVFIFNNFSYWISCIYYFLDNKDLTARLQSLLDLSYMESVFNNNSDIDINDNDHLNSSQIIRRLSINNHLDNKPGLFLPWSGLIAVRFKQLNNYLRILWNLKSW